MVLSESLQSLLIFKNIHNHKILFVMRFLISLIAIAFATASVFAGQVMIKGKVMDKFTNAPHEAEITFKDPSGKKIKVKSNKLTGDFQQLLDGGTAYEATVLAGDLYRETFEFNTRISDSAYVEQSQNLEVHELVVGRELERYNGFSGGSLSADAQKRLKAINKVLRFNRGLTMDIVVADDAKKAAVEDKVMKFKAVAKRINLVVDPAVGNEIIYRVNKNENLFGND